MPLSSTFERSSANNTRLMLAVPQFGNTDCCDNTQCHTYTDCEFKTQANSYAKVSAHAPRRS